jgi:hypothetical protein
MKKIEWLRWSNPLGGSVEFVPEDTREDEWVSVVRPVIPTASGLMPVTVYANFAAHFNFWMMHTNFNISKSVLDVLRRVPGVETLDVVARYHARVGFGRCFDDREVRREIGEMLGVTIPAPSRVGPPEVVLDRETSERVDMIRASLSGKYRFWAIYVIPNGEVSVVRTDKGADYERWLDLYRRSRNLVGGMIFASHED